MRMFLIDSVPYIVPITTEGKGRTADFSGGNMETLTEAWRLIASFDATLVEIVSLSLFVIAIFMVTRAYEEALNPRLRQM